MTQKLRQNPWVKGETESWWLSLAKTFQNLFFYLFLLFLPTQLGKHFWPSFSFVLGQRVDYLSPTLYLSDILLLVLFLCVVLQKKLRIHPYFSVLVLYLSLSIFVSASPLAGWYWLLKFCEVSFVAWFVASCEYNMSLSGVLLAIGIIWESFLAVMQVFFEHSVGGFFYLLGERTFSQSTPGIANASINGQLVLRPYGTFSHPNMLAGFFVVAALLVLFLLYKRMRVLTFLVMATGTIGLTLSLSRAAFATWVFVGIATLLIFLRRKIGKAILLLTLSVGSAFLIAVSFFPQALVRFSSFTFGQSLFERETLAKAALDLFASHPLLGVGPNNFLSQLPQVEKTVLIVQPVHTIYLLIAAELGTPGLLFFLGFFLLLYQKFFTLWIHVPLHKKLQLLPLCLSLSSLLFLGLFDHYFLTLQQGQLLLGLVAGFVYRTVRFATIEE